MKAHLLFADRDPDISRNPLETQMYDLSSSLARRARASDLLLRAERRADGRRTFKIIRGEPEPTSYGRDLYEEIVAR